MTTLSHPGAAAAAPLRGVCAALAHRLRLLHTAWRRRCRHARTQRELLALGAHTLRDIGLTRAEIGSVSAELHGLAERTRARRP